MTDERYNPGLHRIAVLTVGATLPLIALGGLVTSHGAGMSVPDWPNTYGYNMFLFPPRLWIGGILYEHTHRLMGTVVGLLSIVLTIAAWLNEPRKWVRWLATGVLAAVIFQGVLGGLRVVLVELDLAIVHACFAQAFFCLATLTAVVTSRWWISAPDRSAAPEAAQHGRRLARIGCVAVVAIYLQLIVGAMMRHNDAGLAIPDVPLAYGHVLPPVSEAGVKWANQTRVYDLHLAEVSLWQIWLHFGHRVGAILVTMLLIGLIAATLRRERGSVGWGRIIASMGAGFVFLSALGMAHAVGSTRGVAPGAAVFSVAVIAGFTALTLFRRMGDRRPLIAPASMLGALLAVQVTLGVLTVVLRKPADVASAHVAVGAVLLATTFMLAARTMRLYSATFRRRRATDLGPVREDSAGAGVRVATA